MSNVTILKGGPANPGFGGAVVADQKTILGSGTERDPLKTGETSGGPFVGSDVGIGPAHLVGEPVYTNGSGDQEPAKGDSAATSSVAGIISSFPTFSDPTAPFLVQPSGVLTLTTAQWDAVAGTSGGLTPGTVYYLSQTTAGHIITTPAGTPGLVTTQLGQALSATRLLIQIGVPIPH